jgi:hypothetical protein
LAAHLVEKWSDLGGAELPLRQALTYVDGPRGCSEAAQKVSCAFLKAYAAAATGASSVRAALQAHAVPDLSKRAAKLFAAPAGVGAAAAAAESAAKGSPTSSNSRSSRSNPLRALRQAQVQALFGDALEGAVEDDAGWVAAAAWAAKPVQRLLGDREAFLQQALLWAVTHRAALAEPARVTACLNFFDEMRSIEVYYYYFILFYKSILECLL